MATFQYPSLYANGLNSNTQLRRSADMVYQRGGTYEIVLSGDTLQPSIELDVDLNIVDKNNFAIKVGRMALVPYSIVNDDLYEQGFVYRFNLRPYDYMSNYVESEHFQYYWKNDWFQTTNTINLNKQYLNI